MSNVLTVLKQGMSTEIWGKRFYEQAVERTLADDGKKVFQSLVDEENKHLDILRGQYAAVTQDKDWVSIDEAIELADSVDPTDIFPEAMQADQLIPAGTTDEEALKMAMDFEQRGYNLYMQAAEGAESNDAKAIWEWLAKAENAHYVYLQETYEFLTNKGKWYFDDREKPFFEG